MENKENENKELLKGWMKFDLSDTAPQLERNKELESEQYGEIEIHNSIQNGKQIYKCDRKTLSFPLWKMNKEELTKFSNVIEDKNEKEALKILLNNIKGMWKYRWICKSFEKAIKTDCEGKSKEESTISTLEKMKNHLEDEHDLGQLVVAMIWFFDFDKWKILRSVTTNVNLNELMEPVNYCYNFTKKVGWFNLEIYLFIGKYRITFEKCLKEIFEIKI
jgi:hypothetical protein